MRKQLCAALLASSLLTTSVVLADPSVHQTLPEQPMLISAPSVAGEVATVTIGSATAKISGQEIKLPFAPYLHNGVTMAPLEALAQFLNTRPTYNPQDETVTIDHRGKSMVSFRLGEGEVRLGNGTLKQLPAVTEVIEGQTAIPLRALAELFEIQVLYDDGVITLVRQAHQDYRVGFLSFEGKLMPAFDYSPTPKVYVGYAKDYLIDYPKDQGDAMILAISQPGQELMIQSIEVKEDRVVVHVIPESRWSNAPAGTMGLVHYGPRRVVELLDPLPAGLRLEIDGYELPPVPVREAAELAFSDFAGRLQPDNAQLKEASAFGQMVNVDGQEQLVLVASLGERQTGGYAIEVLWVEKAEDRLIIHAQETTPAPGAAVIQAITYPYQAVVVDRAFADWELELKLVQAVNFRHAEWLPVNSYEPAELGVMKATGIGGKLLLTVCAGERPNPGYGLKVERIERENNLLLVHARITAPAPGTIWAQVVTYPRDLVELDAAHADCLVQLVIH